MSHQTARTDPYQLVTDTILAHLDRGVVPWRCPWNRSTGRPRNFHSGHEYRGVNVLLLGLLQFASPWWMIFRQVQERGGKVRKGEHGAFVMKWGRHDKTVKHGDGTEEKKKTFFLKSYKVFNATQIEGIEFPRRRKSGNSILPSASRGRNRSSRTCPRLPPFARVLARRRVIAFAPTRSRCPRSRGSIPRRNFISRSFDELIHSTGHESRLARKGIQDSDGFGGKVYSQEELIAEMGAAFLGMEAGIVRDQHEQSAAYLKGWLDVLKEPDHRRWIVLAANQAGRAVDFILGRMPDDIAPTPAAEEPAEAEALPTAA